MTRTSWTMKMFFQKLTGTSWGVTKLRTWLQKLGKEHGTVGPACKVSLFDLTRGLPQRIESQYRRHWGFTLALWNLYFRERLNLGASLSVKTCSKSKTVDSVRDEDAAMTAATLVQQLDHGYYRDENNKRRKINGDFCKLNFAEHLTDMERKLLADFFASVAKHFQERRRSGRE